MTLYEIRNEIDGRKYVGVTSRNVESRWREHLKNLSKGIHRNQRLQAAWNKYGKDAFSFSVIESFTSLEAMNKAEQDLIISDSNLYNIAKGESKPKPRNGRNRNLKKIFKFTLNGNLMGEVDRSTPTPSGMIAACNGHKLSYKGFIYSFDQDCSKQLERLSKDRMGFIKKDKKGTVLSIYSDMGQVLKEHNFTSTANIYRCCEGKRQTAYGFKWESFGGGLSQ